MTVTRKVRKKRIKRRGLRPMQRQGEVMRGWVEGRSPRRGVRIERWRSMIPNGQRVLRCEMRVGGEDGEAVLPARELQAISDVHTVSLAPSSRTHHTTITPSFVPNPPQCHPLFQLLLNLLQHLLTFPTSALSFKTL